MNREERIKIHLLKKNFVFEKIKSLKIYQACLNFTNFTGQARIIQEDVPRAKICKISRIKFFVYLFVVLRKSDSTFSKTKHFFRTGKFYSTLFTYFCTWNNLLLIILFCHV